MTLPVQAVTFDLWQTLMHDTKEQAQRRAQLRAERMHQALAGAGIEISREEVETACRDVWQTWQTTYWDKHTDPGFDAQLEWLRQRFGGPEDAFELRGELRAGYVEPIFAIPPRLDHEAITALTRLEARGLKLGLICNTSVTPGFALRRLLAGWGLDRLLTVQLFSDELGIRKPAPEVFREAARQLEVDVSAMLHAGDRADVDVQGALDAGARAVLVDPDMPLSKLVVTITSS